MTEKDLDIAIEKCERIMEKLKPCPFCGGNAVLIKHPYATYFPYYVRCDNFANCAIVGVATCSCKTPEEAIAAWNHREGERYDTTESQ